MNLVWCRLLAGSALFGSVALAVPASAHHSAAMFDFSKTVMIQGTVKDFQFINPHGWLIVVTRGADGKDSIYSFELGTVTAVTRAGFAHDSFTRGEKVTVSGHPMKDGRPAAEFISAVKADGKTLSMHY